MSRQFTWSFGINSWPSKLYTGRYRKVFRSFLAAIELPLAAALEKIPINPPFRGKEGNDDACLAEEKSLPPQVATKLARQTTLPTLERASSVSPPPLVKNEENFSWSLSERNPSARTRSGNSLQVARRRPSNPDRN